MPLTDILSTDARRGVENVRAAAARVWKTPLHRYYTDHTVDHSERIIALLDGLTAGMMNTDKRLSPGEVFVLLAAAYLHDIGMQNERFAGGDLEAIRTAHHEQTAEMIYCVWEDPANAVNLALGDDPALVEAVALVAQAHREGAAHRKVDLSSADYDPLPHGGETLRLRLLGALIRFADELDIDNRRVDLEQIKLMNLPVESQLHWWKCHYVSGVSIVDEYIRIAYRLPKNRPDYEQIIKFLVEKEIREKLADLEPIFRENLVKVALGTSSVRLMRLVQPLPEAVEQLAREVVGSGVTIQKPRQKTPSHDFSDYVAEMDDFVSGLDSLKFSVERSMIGQVVVYVFFQNGVEIGRINIKPAPKWHATPVLTEIVRTAAKRGADSSFEEHETLGDWPEEEKAHDREFTLLLKRSRAHFDLWFGKGQWAVVWGNSKTSTASVQQNDQEEVSMSRKADLERHMQESFGIVHD